MKNIYALIVEDQVDSAEVIARVLEYHQRTYAVAHSVDHALDVIEEQIPSIIIADLALPGRSGWELLRIVRNRPLIAKAPVVAITAFHSAAIARETIEAGFNAYFPKPLDTTAFVRELDRLLEIQNENILELG